MDNFTCAEQKEFEYNSKILIGYLWYFMTTFLSYTAKDFETVERVINPLNLEHKRKGTEAIIDDLREFDDNGIGTMADIISLFWRKIPLLAEAPNPVAKRSWNEAWAEFIRELPIDTDTMEEMLEDLDAFVNLEDYIDYMRYIVDNPYPHDSEEWYTVFIPLLRTMPLKRQ